MRRKILVSVAVLAVVLIALTTGTSVYMLDYALKPDPNRRDTAAAYARLFKEMPEMRQWTDSVRSRGLLRDTFITNMKGDRLHGLYMLNDTAKGRTAIILHGYRDSAIKFLYLGRMYHDELGCNIILPDLYGHGLSDGEEINMGWHDRGDILRWGLMALRPVTNPGHLPKIIVHGVSMGAAMTMTASSIAPEYFVCFVEDCGYTSVWDEFAHQLRQQFGLPEFPLMHTTSALCRLRYGWDFKEASPKRVIEGSAASMLFIHGGDDTFVPTEMAHELYDAKEYNRHLWIAPGSGHAKSYLDHPEEYTRRVKEFIMPAIDMYENHNDDIFVIRQRR